MKNLIKKTAATTLSVLGILSMMPSALCATGEEGEKTQNVGANERGHIDELNIMVAGKYLSSVKDLCNLSMVNKKYEDLLKKYRFNPVRITSREQLDLFPSMEIYLVGENEGDFVLTFPDRNIKNLVYLPGSFNLDQFREVLNANGISFGGWKRTLELNSENPMDGCRLTFTNNKDKKIVFMFNPFNNENLTGSYFNGRNGIFTQSLNSMEYYNDFLQACGVEDVAKVTLKEKIVIPSNITSIGCLAFANCTNLQEVTIPDSVISIGNDAFNGCKNLREISIPDSVTSIGNSAFAFCDNLNTINIPTSVTSIEDGAFQGCENLNHIGYNGKVYTDRDSFLEAFRAANNKFEFCTIC